MSEAPDRPRSAIVFGARNLGHTIIQALVADGWSVAGVAQSRSTLDRIGDAGALALEADVTDPASVAAAFEAAGAAHGGVDLAVNAASPRGGESRGPFGGGPIVDTAPEAFDAWTVPAARGAFSFLSAGGRFARAQGGTATLIQITGGSTRRAIAGRGLWAAAAFAVRAITNAAALELRPDGIQVTLLIVDAGISRPGAAPPAGVAAETLASPEQIAEAVLFLARQQAPAATHELQLTPLAERWTP